MASDNNPSSYTATSYNKIASFVYSKQYTSAVLELLDPKPGERIIDFGCGSGELTLNLANIVGSNGLVVGVDASESMIQKTRSNGIEYAFVSDVQDLVFPSLWSADHQTFDAVFTNAALHWCARNPRGVLASAARVLRPNGRFVGEMGGFANCVGVRTALHAVLRKRGINPVAIDPWFFPSISDYQSLLEAEGFRVDHISLHPRLTPLIGPLIDWLQLFCRNSFLKGISDDEAETILNEVQDFCKIDCCDTQGNWSIMYVRLRFVAIKSPA